MEEMMTVEQLAEYLKISLWTAYELVHKKGFPSFRVGKRILVAKAKLMEWIAMKEKEGI